MKIQTPNKIPLVLILIGTTILAVPAALGTYALFDYSSPPVFNEENLTGKALLIISICGFLLYAGYILTAIFQKHSKIFWLCSAVYNFCISACYVLVPSYVVLTSSDFKTGDIVVFMMTPYVLLPFWTIFVTISSYYYFKVAFKKFELP